MNNKESIHCHKSSMSQVLSSTQSVTLSEWTGGVFLTTIHLTEAGSVIFVCKVIYGQHVLNLVKLHKTKLTCIQVYTWLQKPT
jgi:hypothetical protein